MSKQNDVYVHISLVLIQILTFKSLPIQKLSCKIATAIIQKSSLALAHTLIMRPLQMVDGVDERRDDDTLCKHI